MGAQYIIGDTKGFRRWTLIQILIITATESVGIALKVLAPITMSPSGSRDIGILFAVVSIPILAYQINSYKKIPKVCAYYLGVSEGPDPARGTARSVSLTTGLTTRGIWENRALVAPWGRYTT